MLFHPRYPLAGADDSVGNAIAERRVERTDGVRTAVVALAAIVLVGCRTGRDDSPKPVPECEQYEHAYDACTGQKLAIANQPAALPTSEEQRTRLTKLCSENLARLKQDCR